MSPSVKRLLRILVPAEAVLCALAWRDLSGRSDASLRGSRWFWRVMLSVNPGNSILYWLFARRG